MACLIRPPLGRRRGCLSFTTPERDQVVYRDPDARRALEQLKPRFLLGLHHNWHDHGFAYDPLFDFSMAGDGDLVEKDGRPFPRVALDACNFAPASFRRDGGGERFWDVLNVSRAVAFKGLPEFLAAIRAIYDRGRVLRVLQLCPVPPASPDGSTLHDIRERFEAMFSAVERQSFTLLAMPFDYPFPLDLDTLAFLYRSSRVYVHAAPQERRCRTAAYAWASGLPVVARENVASIVPPALRRPPFWFAYERDEAMADAILAALEAAPDDPRWGEVAGEFQAEASVHRLAAFLDALAIAQGGAPSPAPIVANNLDLRLGRHHGLALGMNRVPQTVTQFCARLSALSDAALAELARRHDPELALAEEPARPEPMAGAAATVADAAGLGRLWRGAGA
jgi:glycosyltransferase involved in cell wall biosynthesis